MQNLQILGFFGKLDEKFWCFSICYDTIKSNRPLSLFKTRSNAGGRRCFLSRTAWIFLAMHIEAPKADNCSAALRAKGQTIFVPPNLAFSMAGENFAGCDWPEGA